MNEKLKAVFAAALSEVDTLADFEEVIADFPETYRDALAEEIDARKQELTPAPELDLNAVTAAELAELLTQRPDLRDTLSDLLSVQTDASNEESCECGDKTQADCDTECATPADSEAPAPEEEELILDAEPVDESIVEDTAPQEEIADEEETTPELTLTTTAYTEGITITGDLVLDARSSIVNETGEPITISFQPAGEVIDEQTHNTMVATAERLGITTDGLTAGKLAVAVDRAIAALPSNPAHNRNIREPRLADTAMRRLYGQA